MMSVFDDREKAFELRYARDEDFRFRAEARRNKLLALWAADRMNLAADAAGSYARTVVREALVAAGDDRLAARIADDLARAGIGVAIPDIRAVMGELAAVARLQVRAES